MKLSKLQPKKALNKAFLKVKPNRKDIEVFKAQLVALLDHANDTESEEFHKNLVADFLKNTYYAPHYFINTKGRNDLVIHKGETAKSSVGVIIETKKPTNKAEMLTQQKMNVKAFHELVLYYLRERITLKNLEMTHLIATNIYEWFIFDANVFEKAFAQNKQLVKQFQDFEAGRLSGKTTDFFYKEIAEPRVRGTAIEFTFTYFDIREYETPLRDEDGQDDNKFIALFKLFSPEHVLKLPFTNDSNTLDKSFYTELLHVIGLTETKVGKKKLIERKQQGQRDTGSLLENVIVQLDALDKVRRLTSPGQFGETYEERLFNVGLELVITWMNRILFLKLLEAQLLTYHKGSPAYAFLNSGRIKDFDDLNSLFFQVLARMPEERNADIKQAFDKITYLNSSLFEPTELEHMTVLISNLTDDKTLPLHPSTVLRDDRGNRRAGSLNTLEYLFAFLEAYDFASEGTEEIQEENKSLINASVLGLIFEKINGYKDGSFFTPGFVTMYMCREAIRRAVIQKFNDRKQWNCQTLVDVCNNIQDRGEANDIVNSLRICDPAVGSGHFLVSALNELLAIKQELHILQDREGRWLKEYQLEVVNDDLIVTDEDGELFEYNPTNKESQRIQVTLFHEKQTIIEHCLFGVDINPNSVKICRLRLWIELLKNAYYTSESRLETLPNIDINIKCGNSLINRFALETDLKQALRKSQWNITTYRNAVHSYREAENKEEKRNMEQLIADIKGNFRTEISNNDPKVKRLSRLQGELYSLLHQQVLFDESAKEKRVKQQKQAKLEEEISQLSNDIEEIKHNRIYEHAFEWRFEFPEVLNDHGDFIGFDAVIGNPPYVLIQNLGDKRLFNFYKSTYSTATYKIDTYPLFYEKGIEILKADGILAYISPNTFLKNKHARNLRKILLQYQILEIINFYSRVFEDASVDTLILMAQKALFDDTSIHCATYAGTRQSLENLQRTKHKQSYFKKDDYEIEVDIDQQSLSIFQKIKETTVPLGNIGRAYFGIQTFNREKYVSCDRLTDDYYPVIDGGHVKRYYCEPSSEYVMFAKEAIKSGGDASVYQKERIVVRQIGVYPEGTIVPPNLMTLNTIYNIFVYDEYKKSYPLPYILGIINSRLIQFFWKKKFYDHKATFPKIKKTPLESIPIAPFGSDLSKKIYQKSEMILEEKKQSQLADTRELERDVDRLVYEIYGMREEDIQFIDAISG